MHYKSDHSESTNIDKEIEFYKENNIPYQALKDGKVIVINGEEVKFFRS